MKIKIILIAIFFSFLIIQNNLFAVEEKKQSLGQGLSGVEDDIDPEIKNYIKGYDRGLYLDLIREVDLSKKERHIKKEYKVLNEELNKKMSELASLRDDLSKEMEEKIKGNENIRLIVQLYESISADQAAQLLQRLPKTVAVNVFKSMGTRKSSKILGAMDPKAASELSRLIIKSPIAQK